MGGMDFTSMFSGGGSGGSGGGAGGSAMSGMGGSAGGIGPEQVLQMIRSGVSSSFGAAQLFTGFQNKKKAKQAEPGLTDPGQVATLEYLKQKAKGFGTGSAFTAEKAMVGQNTAATRSAIARNTGGDVGATIGGMVRAQQAGNAGIAQVIAGASQREQFFTQAFVKQENLVAQRKLELQLLKQSKLEAKAASQIQSGTSNLMGGLMMS